MITFNQFKILSESYDIHAGTQYGSNYGGIHTHKGSGNKYYIKFPRVEEQSRVEAATSDIYNKLGIRTLNAKTELVGDRRAVITPWNPAVKSLNSPSQYHSIIKDPVRERELARMHNAAVLTGNLDVVGMDYSNVMQDTHTKELISADQGGAMHFRAQGAPKDYLPSIEKEIKGFQNPMYESGKVFSKIPSSVLADTAKELKNLSDSDIDSIMSQHGLQKHAETMKQRRNLILSYYGHN